MYLQQTVCYNWDFGVPTKIITINDMEGQTCIKKLSQDATIVMWSYIIIRLDT